MDKVYNPLQIESKWYQFWEQNNAFAPSDAKQSYCIMIPPPNVTGRLHMGHAFQDSIMDALIRYHRMRGYSTLWQMGTDHAGIATQMVVERQLAEEKVSRHDLGRDKFVDKIWEWKQKSGGFISSQLKRMGASVDWSRERFTMDEGLSKAVQKVFITLYRENLIYRGKRLVNWDPVLNTAVSDLEVISEEEDGSLWHIKYPVENSNEHITIATTRPETMLGDTAVAIHPEDERYKHLLGKYIKLPLCDRDIPIIADDYVDKDFGTGCVKITPAHDFNDNEMGKRHDLPLINILTKDAKINENAPKAYQGMDRFDARKQIIKDLESQGLLDKIEPHKLKVPRGDRTGTVIEPLLTEQWFVKAKPLAEPAVDIVKQGKIKFVPENWSKTYYNWLENIEDWCISRQLWWGHRIPAWYDEAGNIYVGESIDDVRAHYKLANDLALTQDEDVLDTWFSSALWPFSTLGWPDKTPEFEKFYPTNVLVTGFDIIFFWVARMIMFGLKFGQDIPFDTVYIHGLIQDSQGQKMSKSKGNVLDPIDLIDGIGLEDLVAKRLDGLMQPKMAKTIEKNTRRDYPEGIPQFGTDALRYTFCALATTGRHLRFDTARIESYRNFCNKIWNATRFILMHTENCASDLRDGAKSHSLADNWILSKWQRTKKDIIEHFAIYRFDLVATDIYEFTWNEFCDWYLELAKPVLQNEASSDASLRATKHTLLFVLEELMRVIHPIMPFITEEIWQKIAPLTEQTAKSLITHSYPEVDENLISDESEQQIEFIKQFVVGIRNIRGEMNISPNKALNIILDSGSETEHSIYSKNQGFIHALAKIESSRKLESGEKAPASSVAVVGNLKILIPIKGLIDVDAEIARLEKEIAKINKELDKACKKLDNPNYVAKAPAEVVQKEQDKVAGFKAELDKLQDNIKSLQSS